MKALKIIFAIVMVNSLVAAQSSACTLFAIPDSTERVIAASMDWTYENGLLLVNKRHVLKTAYVSERSVVPAQWVSSYGSITFSQVGREFPWAGINEKGLAVYMLWLEITKLPDIDGLPVVDESQWIQYQLDNFESTQEVLSHLDRIRIHNPFAPVHYFVCDRSLECAVIEFLEGETVVYSGDSLPIRTLSNTDFRAAWNHYEEVLSGKKPLLGKCIIPGHGGPKNIGNLCSTHRFVRGSYYANLKYDINIDYLSQSFAFLDKVRMDMPLSLGMLSFSKWHIIYNTRDGKVHFRTWNTRKKIKWLDLDDFDYSCLRPIRMLDVSSEREGNVVPAFEIYDREKTKQIVTKDLLPFQMHPNLEERWEYPDLFTHCLE